MLRAVDQGTCGVWRVLSPAHRCLWSGVWPLGAGPALGCPTSQMVNVGPCAQPSTLSLFEQVKKAEPLKIATKVTSLSIL